jgi:hypothetical protein
VTPTAARVVKAVAAALDGRNLEDCAGGIVSIILKLDAAGARSASPSGPRSRGMHVGDRHGASYLIH